MQTTPTEAETDFLLDCALDNGFINGVVGWISLTFPSCHAIFDRSQENQAFNDTRRTAAYRRKLRPVPDSAFISCRQLEPKYMLPSNAIHWQLEAQS